MAGNGAEPPSALQKKTQLRHCLNVGLLGLRILGLHLQRMAGTRSSDVSVSYLD
jgi:hypothetical protein